MKDGFVTVITGNGKGKSTAGFGMALRASGWGKKVLIAQFLKKGNYGELRSLKKLPLVDVKQFGKKKLTDLAKPDEADKALARKGLAWVAKAIETGRYDLAILDEINLVIRYRLINKDSVIGLIKNRPKDLDLVLTGRQADPEIIKQADLVSQVKNIKHPYSKGVSARKGFEY